MLTLSEASQWNVIKIDVKNLFLKSVRRERR